MQDGEIRNVAMFTEQQHGPVEDIGERISKEVQRCDMQNKAHLECGRKVLVLEIIG
jgi:hypothetical protein